MMLCIGFIFASFVLFTINKVISVFNVSDLAYASIIVISLTNITSDIYQYKNSKFPKLDTCRVCGIALFGIMFILSVGSVSLYRYFASDTFTVISSVVFVIIGLLILINYGIRLRIVYLNELYASEEYKGFQMTSIINQIHEE